MSGSNTIKDCECPSLRKRGSYTDKRVLKGGLRGVLINGPGHRGKYAWLSFCYCTFMLQNTLLWRKVKHMAYGSFSIRFQLIPIRIKSNFTGSDSMMCTFSNTCICTYIYKVSGLKNMAVNVKVKQSCTANKNGRCCVTVLLRVRLLAYF